MVLHGRMENAPKIIFLLTEVMECLLEKGLFLFQNNFTTSRQNP